MTQISPASVNETSVRPESWRDWRSQKIRKKRHPLRRLVMSAQVFRDAQLSLEAYQSGGLGIIKGLGYSLRGRSVAVLQVGSNTFNLSARALASIWTHSFQPLLDVPRLVIVSSGKRQDLFLRRSRMRKLSRWNNAYDSFRIVQALGSFVVLEGANLERSPFIRSQRFLYKKANRAWEKLEASEKK